MSNRIPAADAAIERKLQVLGDDYVIKLGAPETGGAYGLVEILCRPGGGTPPHVHSREDEGFMILEGEIEFHVGESIRVARAGDAVHAPRDVPHMFTNRSSEPARLLVMAVPAGQEPMFEEIAALPPGPPDLPTLLEITSRYGITLLPPE